MAFETSTDKHGIIIRVDPKKAVAFLRLAVIFYPRAVARAINRTLLDIREESAAEVSEGLDFHTPTSEKFLANVRSFPFDQATPKRLRGVVRTTVAAGKIIATQEEGYTLTPSLNADPAQNLMRLVGGKTQPFFSVPDESALRPFMSARGRVPKALTPKGLLAARAKAQKSSATRKGKPRGRKSKLGSRTVFLNKARTGLFQRMIDGSVRRLYGLFTTPKRVEPRLDIYERAARVAVKKLPMKVVDEIIRETNRMGGR